MVVQNFEPKEVLVTGGCGFIGSNFLNFIHSKWISANFVNVDKLCLNSDVNYVSECVRNSKRYKIVLADIRNSQVISQILKENKIDTVIHFAANCTSTQCYSHPSETYENNVLSYIEFLEAVYDYGEVKKFVHISTDEVYGDSSLNDNEKPKNESEALLPGNPYAATKIASEHYANFFQQNFGLPILILRINNIYGPNQWNIKLVPHFIERAIRQQKFPVQGSGLQLRSWLYVNDAANGIRLATERGVVGEVYNLGTYYETNVLDLAHKIQKEVSSQLGYDENRAVEFDFIQDRPYNDLRYLIDISKARDQLGWQPETPFNEGLRNVVRSQLKLIQKNQTQKMHIIIYGGNGYIGKQVQGLLKKQNIPFQLAKSKIGTNTEQEVINELNNLRGTHVLCCTGRTHGGNIKTIEYLENGADKLYENLRDNFFCPLALGQICKKLGLHYTYVGTGYLYAYDQDHTIGGKAFTENDFPTFFGNSYSVVKGFTDRIFNLLKYTTCINARITLPLNYEFDEERNLLTKILYYKQIVDIPVSFTIIPDCFPALFELMEKWFQGTLNLVNPEPLSLHEILQIYKQILDKNLPPYERITTDSEKGRILMATKGNCALDTTLLVKHFPNILTAKQSLEKNFEAMKASRVIEPMNEKHYE